MFQQSWKPTDYEKPINTFTSSSAKKCNTNKKLYSLCVTRFKDDDSQMHMLLCRKKKNCKHTEKPG